MLADQEEGLCHFVAAEMELRIDAEFEDRHFIEIAAAGGFSKKIGAILAAHVVSPLISLCVARGVLPALLDQPRKGPARLDGADVDREQHRLE